uniref:tRNA wybutosine-synthesizing protein 4 isoform X2 n=1 Tax=Myxine glutinosa TaxID=7769 RepID=UPI00358E4E08
MVKLHKKRKMSKAANKIISDTKQSGSRKDCRTKRRAAEAAVQGTNDSSVLSKASMAALGYFPDNFVQYFAGKACRRAPLINRGYYVRSKAVDTVIRSFLAITEDKSLRQVLSLGAGFDSTYFRLKAEGLLNGVTMFEVDFPAVVRRKVKLVASSVELSCCLSSALPNDLSLTQRFVCLQTMDYKLLGMDLCQLQDLEKLLSELGLDFSLPTLVLSECVLTYVAADSSSQLIAWTARVFPNAVFCLYEQIQPGDAFGAIMEAHFVQLGSPLRTLHHFPSKEAQRMRFLEQGWQRAECMDMNQFYLNLPFDERQRVDRLEPFDEYEEWHLKCLHYFILVASKGDLCQEEILPIPTALQYSENGCRFAAQILRPCSVRGEACPSFGHASCCLAPGLVLTLGGFGVHANRHGRLTVVRLLKRDECKAGWEALVVEVNTIGRSWGGSMFPSLTPVRRGEALLFGGRHAPGRPREAVYHVSLEPGSSLVPQVTLKELMLSGPKPEPRWRHAAVMINLWGLQFLIIHGGKCSTETVLDDCHFLNISSFSWTKMSVRGPKPQGRHSHTASVWEACMVIAGGLGADDLPLACVHCMSASQSYGSAELGEVTWSRLLLKPPLLPRYSHTAHVLGSRLVLIGGVGIHTPSLPPVATICLRSGNTFEFTLDTPRGKRKRLSSYQIFLDRDGGGVQLAEGFGAGPGWPAGPSLDSMIISCMS